MLVLIFLIIFLILLFSIYSDVKFINTSTINTKNITINVLFLVRDGEKYLLNNLNKIETFCKDNFGNYKILFL
jgi:hypothetical protein